MNNSTDYEREIRPDTRLANFRDPFLPIIYPSRSISITGSGTAIADIPRFKLFHFVYKSDFLKMDRKG